MSLRNFKYRILEDIGGCLPPYDIGQFTDGVRFRTGKRRDMLRYFSEVFRPISRVCQTCVNAQRFLSV